MKKAPFLLPIVLLFGLVLLAACSDDDGTGGPTETNAESSPTDPSASGDGTATPGVTPRPITGRECEPGPQTGIGLISYLEFSEESSLYAPGEDITMNLVLRNCAANNVELFYESEARFDFFVENSAGQEVWRWTEEQDLADVPGEVTIIAEEIVEYSVTWDQRDFSDDLVEPGVYKVSAFSLGCGQQGATDCRFGPVELVQIGE